VTAVGRNSRKTQQVKNTQETLPETLSLPRGQKNLASGTQENPFNKAVKEAERSLLIFNLDLGQAPIMNPTTISARVTVSLLNIYVAKKGNSIGNHTQDARDLVDDITSQVKSMEFFGSKTTPCKFPKDTSRNGEFYTVPVKLVFKDRKTAQTAAPDPGIKDATKVVLPTYPNCPSISGLSRIRKQAPTGKTGEDVSENQDSDSCMEEESRVPSAEEILKQQKKVNSSLSPLPQFMNTPKNKSSFAGRSGLISRTPPGSDNDRRGSFGS
jgi:hypothetical protein